jgi:hypothetical protein
VVSDIKRGVFEIRVPRRDEVTGGWRRLQNDKLREWYSSPSIIRMIKSRKMRWAGYVARMGEKKRSCRLLMGKPKGKGPLGRLRRRWVNNIKMDFVEIGWGHMDWLRMFSFLSFRPVFCFVNPNDAADDTE